MRTVLRAGFIAALALTLLSAGVARADTTVVSGDTASGENQPGWAFARDASNAVPYEFVLGNASTGKGSLHVPPIPAPSVKKFIAEHFVFLPVADFTSLSWDYLMAGASPSASSFYINVYVTLPTSSPTKYYDCRFDFIASSGSTASYTTQTITSATPKSGGGGSGCPATIGGMTAGSQIRAYSLNVGDTGGGDIGDAAYLDNVVLQTSAGTDAYDFEPTKDACKKGGWAYSGSPFANQGECVSALEANASAGK